MSPTEPTPPTGLPTAGTRIPAIVVRAALPTTGILLTLTVYRTSAWILLGVLLSLLAAAAPKYLLSWILIVYLAIGELAQPAGLTWQILVLIAGVHLLHLLGMLSLALQWQGSLQLRMLSRPLRRFLAIQIPVQVLAVVASLLLAPNSHGHRPLTLPATTILGAAALAALTLFLLRRRAEDSA